MNAKEYLEQIGIIKNKIESLKRLKERYDELSLSIPGQDFTKDYVQTSKNTEAHFVKWIYKKIECEEKIKELETSLDKLEEKAMEKVETLENEDYKNIIYMHYFNGYSLYDISKEIFISISTVKRWHKKALESIIID